MKKNETCKDLKRSFEKNIIKDMGQNSKEEFDFEYNKIHRHRKVNGTKQNVIVRFRSHQYPSDLYYAQKKNLQPHKIKTIANKEEDGAPLQCDRKNRR